MLRPPISPLRLTIVLPCFNEAANVRTVVEAALRVGRDVAQELEVVVVDDGSRDATASIVAELEREAPEVRRVSHPTNLGYGAALRSGFLAARMPWVFYTDGDGQFDLEELHGILPLLESHDIVSCYRLSRRDGPMRFVLGRAFTWACDALLGLDLVDVNCAFKLYPRALFDAFEIRSRGALVDAEVLAAARALGLRVAQPGVPHRPRRGGTQTGASPKVVARAALELSGLCLRRFAPAPPALRASTRTSKHLAAQ